MKKLLLSLALLAGAAQLSFSLSEYMKDSVFIVNPAMKDFSDAGIREDIQNGRAVQPNPLELKVGDIFVDVNGNAQKVIKIEKKGKKINIETASPEISEIFEYIRIPEQNTDFAKYEDGGLQPSANAAETTSSRSVSSARSVQKAEGRVIDNLMPEGSRSFDLTINLKYWDQDEWIKKVGKQVARLEDGIEKNEITDQEDIKNVQNFTNALRQKNANNSITTNLDLGVGLKFKQERNSILYGFDWSLPWIEKKGPWYSFRFEYHSGGGYAKLEYDGVIDLGLYFEASYYGYDAFSAPTPLSWGSTSFGPYGGLYFDLNLSGGFTVGYDYYKHIETNFQYKREFNTLFITKGTPINTAVTWAPSAHQVYATLNGELKVGPAIKVGLIALGKTLAQGKIHAGGYIDGEFGCAYTIIDTDFTNYQKLYDVSTDPIEENEIFYEQNEDTGKWNLKYPNGFTLLGDMSMGAFLTVTLECWDGKFETCPVNYTIPVLTNHGWTEEWEAEGSDWFTGDH